MPEKTDMEPLPKELAASAALTIQSRLNSVSGGKVLDVATGSGDFIEILMKTLQDYDCFVGIDISRTGLITAEKRFSDKPAKMIEMNAESLGFRNDSFDTISMAYSLHHLQRGDEVLGEMHRVLRPGGTLIITEEVCDGKQTDAQKTSIMQHAWAARIDSWLGEVHRTTLAKHRIEEMISRLRLESIELFESTHPVECLFCERRFRCDDPKSAENVRRSIKEINDGLKKLKKIPDPEARLQLKEMGEALKDRNRSVGNAHPSILLALGKKGSSNQG
jgi:ubiquinone/menaquinone biosynthesis C-methylase UbiE